MRISNYLRHKCGTVMIEGAVICTLLIFMALSVVEIARYIMAHSRADMTAAALANITTQTDTYTLSDLHTQVVPMIMEPFDGNNKVTGSIITSVTIPELPTGTSTRSVQPSIDNTETFGFVKNSTVAIEDFEILRAAPGRYVAVELFHDYQPLVPGMQNIVHLIVGQNAVRAKKIFIDRRATILETPPTTALLPPLSGCNRPEQYNADASSPCLCNGSFGTGVTYTQGTNGTNSFVVTNILNDTVCTGIIPEGAVTGNASSSTGKEKGI